MNSQNLMFVCVPLILSSLKKIWRFLLVIPSLHSCLLLKVNNNLSIFFFVPFKIDPLFVKFVRLQHKWHKLLIKTYCFFFLLRNFFFSKLLIDFICSFYDVSKEASNYIFDNLKLNIKQFIGVFIKNVDDKWKMTLFSIRKEVSKNGTIMNWECRICWLYYCQQISLNRSFVCIRLLFSLVIM